MRFKNKAKIDQERKNKNNHQKMGEKTEERMVADVGISRVTGISRVRNVQLYD